MRESRLFDEMLCAKDVRVSEGKRSKTSTLRSGAGSE